MKEHHPPETPEPAGPQAEALAVALERISIGAVGLTTLALGQADAGFELTFPQWRAILVVGEQPDGIRVGELATRVGVTLPATGRLLRRLERRGLVALTGDDRDRRATRARLSEHGRAVRETILTYRRRRLREVVDSLPDVGQFDLAAGLRVLADELERFA